MAPLLTLGDKTLNKINTLSIDIETYSDVDLSRSGVYRYAESKNSELLLFSYSVNDGPVKLVDTANGEKIPSEIIDAILSDDVKKWAFNASFERVFLSYYLKRNYPNLFKGYGDEADTTHSYLNPSSWYCTLTWAAYLGLPMSLKGVGAILKLEEQKLEEGKDLIKYFCTPCAPTKTNGGRTRNLPHHNKEKWDMFSAYNIRDVEVEKAVQKRLSAYPVPLSVWDEYHMSEVINDRGIEIDLTLVKNAIALDEKVHNSLLLESSSLTLLDNPNSVTQLKGWLKEKGIEVDTLGKKDAKQLMEATDSEEVKKVLSLRLQMAKSSIRKYDAMLNAVCSDNRARGMFFFYGANRTGRYSGRIIQLQNLPRNELEDIEIIRELVKCGNTEALTLLYDDIPSLLSQLIRTAFIPKKGYKFYVADFSAIEARVIAHIAGEKWREELFAKGGDIYCQSASQMFHVPVEKHGINAHLRQKGKIAELACIREGSLVLTSSGLVPIEKVTKDMLVWDGETWVHHDGVIPKGEREVITYDGLSATPDHLVWIEGKKEPVQFGLAASTGAKLLKSGDGVNTIMLNSSNTNRCIYQNKLSTIKRFKAKVYDIQNAGPHHRFTASNCLVHNCGYGGSVGALKAMGALDMGLKEEELAPLVKSWREANPNIVKLWWDTDRAVKEVISNKTTALANGLVFSYKGGMLMIKLPSGRSLMYVRPRLEENEHGTFSVTYEGIGEQKKWERLESYGPKFVENIVQAISRDILLNAIRNLQNEYICAHVHDELIIECKEDVPLDEICNRMATPPSWMPDILLRSDGFVTEFYKKD